MDRLISDDYAKEQKRLHATDPMFGAEGYLWAYLIAGIALIEECTSVLDYGCGKGSLGKILRDVTIEQQSDEAGRQFVFGVREYDPGFPGKEKHPEPCDLVVCLDVMEHIELEHLPAVLDDLRGLTKKLLFVAVSTKLSKRIMSDGRDTHILLRDDEWWKGSFSCSGFKVKRTWNTGLRQWVALLEPPRC